MGREGPADPVLRFARLLQQLREASGNPSLRRLAQLTKELGYPYAYTTVRAYLVGEHHPEWKFVVVFVHACATQAGLAGEPDLTAWRADHRRMLRELAERRRGQRLATTAAAEEVGSPRRLPGVPETFVGRTGAFDELAARVRVHNPDGAVVAIHAIDGLAGVGKTAFVLYAAHRYAERYPDGAFFLDLHGYTAGVDPLPASAALDQLLRDAGLPQDAIPVDPAARHNRWCSVMAGRRALVVLDNARDSEQVRPLLPRASGCLVLITSRRRLTALPEAKALALDVLPLPDAVDQFVGIVGAARCDDREAVERVVTQVGRLPLAVGIVAGRFANEPSAIGVADLAVELSDTRTRLDYASPEDAGLRAAFTVSLRRLTEAQMRMFLTVGMHPGPQLNVAAMSALADLPPATALGRLRDLAEHRLLDGVDGPAPGAWRMHDLVRDFARERVEEHICVADRDAAARRLTVHYRSGLATGGPGWLGAERANLLAFAQEISEVDAATLCIDLGAAMQVQGYWTHAEGLYEGAYRVCRDRAEQPGLTKARLGLADVARLTGRYDTAVALYREALDSCGETGDSRGQARALWGLADVARLTGDHRVARSHHQRSRDISVAAADLRGEANATWGLADVSRVTSDYQNARDHYRRAGDLYADLGDDSGLAGALWGLADVARLTGDYVAAEVHCRRAYGLYIALDDRRGTAEAARGIADIARMTGDHVSAREHYQQSRLICVDLGHRRGEASALWGLGEIARLVAEREVARANFDAALKVCRDLSDRRSQANVLRSLGDLARDSGDAAIASDRYRAALTLCLDLGDRRGEAAALRGLGDVARLTGDYPGAHELYVRVLEIRVALNDVRGRVEVLHGLADVAEAGGDPDEARSWRARAAAPS